MTITKLTGEEEFKSTPFIRGCVKLGGIDVDLLVEMDRVDCGLIVTIDKTDQYYVDMHSVVMDIVERIDSDRNAIDGVKLELIKREVK